MTRPEYIETRNKMRKAYCSKCKTFSTCHISHVGSLLSPLVIPERVNVSCEYFS